MAKNTFFSLKQKQHGKKMYIMRWKIKIKTAKKNFSPITFLIFQPPHNFFLCIITVHIHHHTGWQPVSFIFKKNNTKNYCNWFFSLIFWLFLMNISFSTQEYPQTAAFFSTFLEYVLLSPVRTVRMFQCLMFFPRIYWLSLWDFCVINYYY